MQLVYFIIFISLYIHFVYISFMYVYKMQDFYINNVI